MYDRNSNSYDPAAQQRTSDILAQRQAWLGGGTLGTIDAATDA